MDFGARSQIALNLSLLLLMMDSGERAHSHHTLLFLTRLEKEFWDIYALVG